MIGTAVVIAYVMVYAAKVKKNPQLSPSTPSTGNARRRATPDAAADAWTWRHALATVLFAMTMVLLVWGILDQQWYIEEIAALFLAMGLVLGAVAGLGPSRIAWLRHRRQRHGERRLHHRLVMAGRSSSSPRTARCWTPC